jgi:hypothetical protein
MRSTSFKWFAGSVAFFLPTITVFVTNWILRESYPEAFWTSIVLAAVIPPALLLSSGVTGRRIAFAFGLWLLLAVQFCLILVCLLAGFRE